MKLILALIVSLWSLLQMFISDFLGFPHERRAVNTPPARDMRRLFSSCPPAPHHVNCWRFKQKGCIFVAPAPAVVSNPAEPPNARLLNESVSGGAGRAGSGGASGCAGVGLVSFKRNLSIHLDLCPPSIRKDNEATPSVFLTLTIFCS